MHHCCLLFRKSRDFWGPRWASQPQIAKHRCDFGALSFRALKSRIRNKNKKFWWHANLQIGTNYIWASWKNTTFNKINPILLGPPAPRVAAMKKTLFGALWKMSRIFREIFCGHFPLKLKDENLRKISPKFRCIFRRSLANFSQELRSGGLRAQNFVVFWQKTPCKKEVHEDVRTKKWNPKKVPNWAKAS